MEKINFRDIKKEDIRNPILRNLVEIYQKKEQIELGILDDRGFIKSNISFF